MFIKMRTFKDSCKLFGNNKKIKYISLLMSLGKEYQSSKPNLEPLVLFFNLFDLNNWRIYNQYKVKRFKSLLNCDRFDVNSSIYDKNVINLITIGCLKH